jgi:tRNA dimethylallyltransferase
VYKGLSIGSAKPTLQEQNETKYHMIDMLDCNETMSAGDFSRQAKLTIDTVLDGGGLPVLVGGSTLWMDWITKGVPDAPKGFSHLDDIVEKLVEPYERQGIKS